MAPTGAPALAGIFGRDNIGDTNGYVLVSDYNTGQVLRFHPNRIDKDVFISSTNTPVSAGIGPVASKKPWGIAVDAIQKNLFMASEGLNAILQYTLCTGEYVRTLASVTSPRGLAFENERLLVSSYTEDKIIGFNSETGASFGDFATGIKRPGEIVVLKSPNANHLCHSGCVFVASYNGVHKYNFNGVLVKPYTDDDQKISRSYGLAVVHDMHLHATRLVLSGPHAGHIRYPEYVIMPQLVSFACCSTESGTYLKEKLIVDDDIVKTSGSVAFNLLENSLYWTAAEEVRAYDATTGKLGKALKWKGMDATGLVLVPGNVGNLLV